MAFLYEYENLGLLGDGSDAQVYKVRHNELGYVRAVRLLQKRITNKEKEPELYKSFIREAKYVLRLGNGAHPNIVRIYTPKITEAGDAFWEMDFIDGDTVEKFITHNHDFIPVEEIKRCLLDISSALAYCHVDNYRFSLDRDNDKDLYEFDSTDGSKLVISDENRQELIRRYCLVHNDIKSNNVMRRFDGSYILLDFSLSFGSDKKFSRGSFEGGIEYKAPEKWPEKRNEKWDEQVAQITERADIYSFGVMLYEMLAGQVPFPVDKNISDAEANNEIRKHHKHTPPPPIEPLRKAAYEAANPGRTYLKDYPDWLEKVIMKCLEKRPENRYTNGKELYEEVKPLMEEQKSVIVKVIEEKQVEVIKKVTKPLWMLLSALFFITAVVLGMMYLQKPESQDISNLEDLEQLLAAGDNDAAMQTIIDAQKTEITQLKSKIKWLENSVTPTSDLDRKIDDLTQQITDKNTEISSLEQKIKEKDDIIKQKQEKIKIITGGL